MTTAVCVASGVAVAVVVVAVVAAAAVVVHAFFAVACVRGT